MKIHKNKRGQVTLEAAIAFTITLVFLASVVSSIQFYRTDILMRRSVEQTCEKMSVLYPVSVPAGDALSVVLNAFPDLGIEDSKGAEIVSKAVSVATGLDNGTGDSIKELILKGLFAQTMAYLYMLWRQSSKCRLCITRLFPMRDLASLSILKTLKYLSTNG